MSMNLRTKQMVTQIPVIFVGITILTFVISGIASRNTTKQIDENMNMVVDKTMGELDSWLNEREREATILSEMDLIVDACKHNRTDEARQFLKTYFSHSPVLENLFIANTAGTIEIDGVDGKAIGVEIAQIPVYKKNIDKANEGSIWFSDAQISPVTGRPVSLITAPVKENGKVIGIVGTPIELINFSNTFVASSKIGSSGYVYLIDEFGKTLAHPVQENIMKVNVSDYDFGKEILQKKNGTIHYKWQGVDKISHFKMNPETRWIVASSVTMDEYYASINRIRLITISLGLIIILITSLVIWFSTSKIFTSINGIITGLLDASGQLSSASDQVSTASQSLAESASEQASSIEETSASLEEISAMSKQNAGNASECNTNMKSAGELFNIIDTKLAHLVAAVGEISTNSLNTKKIVKTIDEIAFQTNLLALNAAVEAARAGESGAGFSVVADEVRNLAMRAADAARNTQDLIEKTVASVTTGTEVMGEVQAAVTKNMELGGKVAMLVSEISTASDEQARGIEQINLAISQMDKLTQSMAANSEESAATSEELSSQAQELNVHIDSLISIIGGNGNSAGHQKVEQHTPARQLAAPVNIQKNARRKPVAALPKKTVVIKPEKVIPFDDDEFEEF